MPLPTAPSGLMVMSRTFTQTSVGLTFGGETSGFTVFVDWVGDPVDTGVVSDGFVLGAVENHGERVVSESIFDLFVSSRAQGSEGKGETVVVNSFIDIDGDSTVDEGSECQLKVKHSLDKDNFVVFVNTVLVDPVRVEPKAGKCISHSLPRY